MNEIQTGLLSFLPPRKRETPSGWISFNAPCCHNRGESRDERSRGGLLVYPNGGFRYHCFNCDFNAGWTPGNLLSSNTKNFFKWIGIPTDIISKFGLYALKIKDDLPITKKEIDLTLIEKQLPDKCAPISVWLEQTDLDKKTLDEISKVVEYIYFRGMDLEWYDWHWSPAPGYSDRLIIPYYFNEKIVGWTGRKITDGKPKYLSDNQPSYVFNLDRQTFKRKYLIVVEGQLDAIAIDGVAVMHNTVSSHQIARINSLGKEVIVVPDRDKAGSKIINSAIDQGWSISIPPWEEGIKDVADAVKKYGRLYTLATILHYKESNKIKIQLQQKKLENHG